MATPFIKGSFFIEIFAFAIFSLVFFFIQQNLLNHRNHND